MTHSALALQKAVYAALVADMATGALIGGRIYDAIPRAATFPYVSFGDGTVRDWSTGTEDGAEHRLKASSPAPIATRRAFGPSASAIRLPPVRRCRCAA